VWFRPTLQGDVAHFVVRETIWRLSHGCKNLEGGHGWKKKLDLWHMFIIYNKLSTFIAWAIWPLKYICIVIWLWFLIVLWKWMKMHVKHVNPRTHLNHHAFNYKIRNLNHLTPKKAHTPPYSIKWTYWASVVFRLLWNTKLANNETLNFAPTLTHQPRYYLLIYPPTYLFKFNHLV
jgi:hypothetical protein